MTTIRIGTWNVEYAAGADRNAQRLALLREKHADIWVLTETHDDLDLRPECLRHPPIDHVCVSETLAIGATVRAWEGTAGEVKLSDHSGVVVEVGTVGK